MLKQLNIEQNAEILASAPRLGETGRTTAVAAVPDVLWNGWLESRNVDSVEMGTILREVVGDFLIYKQQVAHEAHVRNAFDNTHRWNVATQASAAAAVAALRESRFAESKVAVEKAATAAAKKFDAVIARLNPSRKHRTQINKGSAVEYHENALANSLKQAEEEWESGQAHMDAIDNLVGDSANFGADDASQQQVLNDLDEAHLYSLDIHIHEADAAIKELRQLAVPVLGDRIDGAAASSAAPTPELRPQLPPVLPAQLHLGGDAGSAAAPAPAPAPAVYIVPAPAVALGRGLRLPDDADGRAMAMQLQQSGMNVEHVVGSHWIVH